MSRCSKPRCSRPGAAVLAYDYDARRAVLQDPSDGQLSPHLYELCADCAENLSPPRGWVLEDRRTRPPLFAGTTSPIAAPARRPPEPERPVVREPARQVFFGFS